MCDCKSPRQSATPIVTNQSELPLVSKMIRKLANILQKNLASIVRKLARFVGKIVAR